MDKVKSVFVVVIFLILLVIGVLELGWASDEIKINSDFEEIGFLKKGKNYLEINKTIYAEELISLNPHIESISYHDDFLNKTIGYINIYGGIGSNFLIESGRTYEINIKKDSVLMIRRT